MKKSKAVESQNSQIVTAITSLSLIGGIVYGRAKHYNFVQTFGIAVLFSVLGYLGGSFLEEQIK